MNEMQATIREIAVSGKGILAADESSGTIAKRLASIHVECTEDNRRAYRELLFTTPKISDFIKGVILYEETLMQKSSEGTPFPELLKKNGIIPGIKVDKGLIPLALNEPEQVTQGLDGLPERLAEYKKLGARFAKWRAVYSISDKTPSCTVVETNAQLLARYAAICQAQGIVPIVEPEVLLDGSHTIQRCSEVSEWVLNAVFDALYLQGVELENMILKPSMVLPGKSGEKASVNEVAEKTLKVLKATVPGAVPTVNFLSGGQTPEEATAHLQEMNDIGDLPWNLSFSYSRALQEPVMGHWKGKQENIAEAQNLFYKRAKLNSLASQGKYDNKMEKGE